jgi:hypothetical protein
MGGDGAARMRSSSACSSGVAPLMPGTVWLDGRMCSTHGGGVGERGGAGVSGEAISVCVSTLRAVSGAVAADMRFAVYGLLVEPRDT